MSSTAYFDVNAAPPVAQVKPARKIPVLTSVQSESISIGTHNVTLVLQDVLFTGNLEMANWTFAVSVQDKLWISKKTNLSFGKTQQVNRAVISQEMEIINNRLTLNIGITAYNMFGNILTTQQQLKLYFLEDKRFYQALIQAEDTNNCMTFRFLATLENNFN